MLLVLAATLAALLLGWLLLFLLLLSLLLNHLKLIIRHKEAHLSQNVSLLTIFINVIFCCDLIICLSIRILLRDRESHHLRLSISNKASKFGGHLLFSISLIELESNFILSRSISERDVLVVDSETLLTIYCEVHLLVA